MMDNLRAAANHVVLKIILGLIIISFVLTGVGNYLIGGNSNYAAEVNGQEISRGQFENAVANERNRQQQQLGDQFSELAGNDGYIQTLRRQVLNQLIDEALLDQYTKKLGIVISDQQIKDAIFNQPAFQVDGTFNNGRYNAIIRNMGLTPDQYAQALRNQLTTEQLVKSIVGTDFMLSDETNELVNLIAQQRIVREATIDVSALAAKQSATDQEIQDNYNRNQNAYIAPEEYKVTYIQLDADAMKKPVTDAEIQSYYDEHKDEFTQPQKDRYSIIQTKTAEEADAILADLKNGADFAKLAKEKSADIISARNGGDMGWIDVSAMPSELKQADLKDKGQISGVIKSSVGFLIFRLDDIQPAEEKPFSAVKSSIRDKVEQEKALDAYYALQQKVSDAASNENESLASAEQVAGVKAVETNWFSRDALPTALNFKPVADAIFNGGLLGINGAPGSNSDIITVDGNKAFVLRISAYKPQMTQPLDDVRLRVIDAVKHEKAVRQAKAEADNVLEALRKGDGNAAMKDAGISFGKAVALTRSENTPLAQVAFALPLPAKDKPSYGMADDSNGNVVILALDEVKVDTLPEAQKQQLTQSIMQSNAQIVFASLMANLRQEAKIKVGDVIAIQ